MKFLKFLTETPFTGDEIPGELPEEAVGVVDQLFINLYEWLYSFLPPAMAHSVTNIVRAITVIIGGFIILKLIKTILKSFVRKMLSDSVVATFATSVITAVGYVVYLLAVLGTLGISTEGLAAFAAASALAIGFALQGSLGNIANGVVILLVKPFKVGDLVNIDGIDGIVKEINLATTLIDTPDNHCVTIPNTLVATNRIINYMRNDLRRLDFTFNIAHGHSTEFIKQLFNEIAADHPDINKKTPHVIAVGDVTSSFVTYFFRTWVKSREFLRIRFDILEATINKLKENNVHFEVEKVVVSTGNTTPGDMDLDSSMGGKKRDSKTLKAEEKLAMKAVAATKAKSNTTK